MTVTEQFPWAGPLARVVRGAAMVMGVVTYLGLLAGFRITVPAEDAVILWIYSRNFAATGVISYVAHGPRVEGATDFAWMVLLAGAIRSHIDPFVCTAAINVVALLLLALFVARCAGVKTSQAALAVAGAAGLVPQIFAVLAGFATLPDAVLLAASVYFCERGRVVAASFSALLFCLFRPDAIVFVVPLLSVILFRRREVRDAATIVLVFLLPELVYQAWRMQYFHEVFPLPFLVKSDVQRVFGMFVANSVRSSVVYVAFAAIVVATVWWYTRRHFVGGRILPGLLVIPTLFYWCVRLDQNVGFRFFYYLPLGAAIVLALNWKLLGAHRSTVTLVSAAAWALLLFPPLRREFRTFRDLQAPDLVAISKDLRAVPHTGVLLSSEAGILPYYSEWQTVDPWGLNTPAFAHHFFQPEQVAELQPSLVHTHPDSTDGCGIQPEWKVPYAARNWTALTRNISAGIDRSRYDVLQTSYGSERYRRRKQWMYAQGDVACWFVRRDIAEHDAVVRILQNHHASLAP